MGLGYQFNPSQDQDIRKRLNGQLSPGVQTALRVMSLRLPTVLGGRPIAPGDLLKPPAPGGNRLPGAVAGSVLRGGVTDLPEQPQSFAPPSPSASPFSMIGGGNEAGALADLVNDSLSGGEPGAHIIPGGGPEPPIRRPEPGSVPVDSGPPAPEPTSGGGVGGGGRLSDLLDLLFRDRRGL